jgi:hypothetical protein
MVGYFFPQVVIPSPLFQQVYLYGRLGWIARDAEGLDFIGIEIGTSDDTSPPGQMQPCMGRCAGALVCPLDQVACDGSSSSAPLDHRDDDVCGVAVRKGGCEWQCPLWAPRGNQRKGSAVDLCCLLYERCYTGSGALLPTTWCGNRL